MEVLDVWINGQVRTTQSDMSMNELQVFIQYVCMLWVRRMRFAAFAAGRAAAQLKVHCERCARGSSPSAVEGYGAPHRLRRRRVGLDAREPPHIERVRHLARIHHVLRVADQQSSAGVCVWHDVAGRDRSRACNSRPRSGTPSTLATVSPTLKYPCTSAAPPGTMVTIVFVASSSRPSPAA